MADPMTREALDAYVKLAENIRERFGDNWQLVDDEDMDEVSARTEDSTPTFFTEMFATSQTSGEDPLEVAGFLAAAIDNVPRMAAMIRQAEADRDTARTLLAAFVPPGTLSPGETPALCGTCKQLSCVPGLPGCAPCTAAEIDRLRAELDRAGRGGRELGRIVVRLAELIKAAFVKGETDQAGALLMLGDHLAELLEDEGGLSTDDHNRIYRALEQQRAEVERLRKELATTAHVAKVTGEKADALRGQRDRAETERDAARKQVKRVREVRATCTDGATEARAAADKADARRDVPGLFRETAWAAAYVEFGERLDTALDGAEAAAPGPRTDPA